MVGTVIFGFFLYGSVAPFRYIRTVKRVTKVVTAWLTKEALKEVVVDDTGHVDRGYLAWQMRQYGFSDCLLPFQLGEAGEWFVFTNQQYTQLIDAMRRQAKGEEQLVDANYLLYAGRMAWRVPRLRKEALANAKRIREAKSM